MHIAFNGWFWDQPHTGSGQYLRRLLHGLRRISPPLNLTLILPGRAVPDDLPPEVAVKHAGGGRGDLDKVWFEQRLFPRLAGRSGADLAHVPYWGTPLSSPLPLVSSVLDVIPLALPEYTRGFRARLYTSLATAAAKGSAHTLTLSAAAKADIVRYLALPEASITVTHLAADEVYHPKLGAERDAAVRAKYNLPDQFVLYLGGFDRRKNVNQLLLAYTYVGQAEGDNIPLVIAGREPAWGTPLFPDLRRYAAELNITDYVRWIGYIDEADKPSLYRLASVFAYPSLYEGFGLGPLEAMACGTPVVANDIPSISEVVADGAYLVPENDARAMAGAIIALLLQQPLRDSLINQGLARATAFSWRKTARQTLDVYERVLQSAG
jgi:glycosyltransferase involved in cell wall biosynthesis